MKSNHINHIVVFATVLCAASAAQAGGWRLTIGPAYRARMKTEMRGAPAVADTTEIKKSDKYKDLEKGDWGQYEKDAVARPDPAAGGAAGVPAGAELWGISASYSETTVSYDGSGSPIDATDHPSSLGLKAKIGYDFYETEKLSVGLDLRFASYWNMKSSAFGRLAGSRTSTRDVTDWWLFEQGPYDMTTPPLADDKWEIKKDPTGTEYGEVVPGSASSGRTVRSRFCADLYQVGLGPTVTWHAFSWLDAYASVAALCNIAALDLEAGSSKTSETQCRIGFAGDIGFAAYITEKLGFFAEAGYEWIDGFDMAIGGVSADVDFSSLVVSAGLAYRF